MTEHELRNKLKDRKVTAVAEATKIHPHTIRKFLANKGKVNKSIRAALEAYINE